MRTCGKDLVDDAFIARVAELRRAETPWHVIAASLGTSERTITKYVRPLLPADLNAPLILEYTKKTKKKQVFALLDAEPELESREVAERTGTCMSTASYYRYLWKEAQKPQEPEPEHRCPGCSMPMDNGRGECELCVWQRNGIVVAYKLIEEGEL